MDGRTEFVAKLSAALREHDVLEQWLTESHWDEHYWDDVATFATDAVGDNPTPATLVVALRTALQSAFDSDVESGSGLYRDHVDRRLRVIAEQACGEVGRGGAP